jgi:hypothetical protein
VGIPKAERKAAKASLEFAGTTKKGTKGGVKAAKEVAHSQGKKANRKSTVKK